VPRRSAGDQLEGVRRGWGLSASAPSYTNMHVTKTSLLRVRAWGTIHRAAIAAGVQEPVTPHTLRHAFASQVLEDSYDIRTIQELLGHKDVSTTMTVPKPAA
jgi:site-specific recombinase XerD